MQWLSYLRELNLLSILLRIALAMLIGGVLGSERGRKNRPAGLRTYMLVCVGSAMVMMTNQYAYQLDMASDPVRMGAQVISGIGFLGAGTIIVTRRNQVKGITTAAGLWASACGGLAVGIGFYEGAIIGGGAIFVIMVLMQRLDETIHQRSNYIELYVEYDKSRPFSDFIDYAEGYGFTIGDIHISEGKKAEEMHYCAVLLAKSKMRRTHLEMLRTLKNAPGMIFVEEI